MKYTLIGAGGIQARGLLHDLLDFSSATEILLADVAVGPLEQRIDDLGGDPRMSAVAIDLRDLAASVEALAGTHVLIMAGPSPLGRYAMDIALGLRCHYVDLGGAYADTEVQLARHEEFAEAGLIAVLGAGSAPGMTNVMARAGAERLDIVRDIEMTVAMNDLTERSSPFHWPFNLAAIIDEYESSAVAIEGCERVLIPPRTGEWVEFPMPIGRVFPIYTTHPEPESLYRSFRQQGLENASFRIAMPAAFHRQMDFLASIGMTKQTKIEVGGVEVAPAEVLVEATKWIPRPAEKEEQYSATRVIVRGARHGEKVEVELYMCTGSHEGWNVPAGMLKTVVPPSIVAEMIGNGAIANPGVWLPESSVPVQEFFDELALRGMVIETTERRASTIDVSR
ncbi:saccharopine dehydrogenase family protein [Ruicaihuangia caeni]|uniref:saccharopine dehydrogenase family protein n=1 Tax=Ruicaihuangia caeni TaxID=3042517 RepID=UPI00338EE436